MKESKTSRDARTLGWRAVTVRGTHVVLDNATIVRPALYDAEAVTKSGYRAVRVMRRRKLPDFGDMEASDARVVADPEGTRAELRAVRTALDAERATIADLRAQLAAEKQRADAAEAAHGPPQYFQYAGAGERAPNDPPTLAGPWLPDDDDGESWSRSSDGRFMVDVFRDGDVTA